jgi:hypothetical protein
LAATSTAKPITPESKDHARLLKGIRIRYAEIASAGQKNVLMSPSEKFSKHTIGSTLQGATLTQICIGVI